MVDSATVITVGLCVRDDSPGLLSSVPSVLSQTIDQPVRFVVVDQTSAGHASEAIDEVAGTHRGIEVLRSDRAGDLSTARNRLLEEAGDGYIAWMECGDVWLPRRLQLQLDALQSAPADGHDHVCVASVRYLSPPREGRERLSVYDLTGDQLKNALCGDLDPSFADLFGPARVFRAAGGFDEGMERLRDRDLLIRILVSGTRLTDVGSEDPLHTRIETGCGSGVPDTTAPDSAGSAAGRALARKHATLLRRYGRRFARRSRRRLLLEDARQLDRHGHLVKARMAHAQAQLLDGPHRTARGRPGGAASDRLRPADAGAKPGRRGGGPSTTAMVADARPSSTESADDGHGGSILSPEPATSALWLRLAEDHRAIDDLDGAEAVLRHALQRHPGDVPLLALLAETRLRLHDWHGCAAVWETVEQLDGAAISDVTYTDAASAYRMLGQHRRALEISEVGSRAWPQSHRVQKELYRARSSLVDWSSCLRPAASSTGVGDPPGVVTHLGFLVGEAGGLEGHLVAGTSGPVSLVVNARPVATTHAQGTGSLASFSLDCHDLLEYLGDGDLLTVEHRNRPLEIEGLGRHLEVRTGYPSRADVLHERLEAGWVFAKFGRLRKGHTPTSKRAIITFLRELSGHVEQTTGELAFPLYGNLLGAIREHDFIAHDVGGFDAGYLSSQVAPTAVRDEFLAVCRGLLEHGYHLTVNPWCAMIRRRSTDTRFIDLNYAWLTPHGELQLSYGWRYPPVGDPTALRTPRECPLGGHLVRVPGNAEDVLQQIYGPGWVTPDQGFDLGARLVRDVEFLLTEAELESLRADWPTKVSIESVLGPTGEVVSRL